MHRITPHRITPHRIAPEESVSWGGWYTGAFVAHAHRVALRVLGIGVEATVYFAEDPAMPRDVLWQTGWLDRTRLGFVDHDSRIYLVCAGVGWRKDGRSRRSTNESWTVSGIGFKLDSSAGHGRTLPPGINAGLWKPSTKTNRQTDIPGIPKPN